MLSRPNTTPIIAEGAVLLPQKVAPLLTDLNHAIWMLPTPEFQVEHYKKRDWIHHILQYDDYDLAFSNWVKRDSRFAQRIMEDVGDMCIKNNTIQVDSKFYN